MDKNYFDLNELKDMFAQMGLANSTGEQNLRREKKYREVLDYLMHIIKAADKLSKKRELVLVDCACGRAYLSFLANHYFAHIEKRKVRFICVDYNREVIASSRLSAEALGFDNMTFICDDILNLNLETPDIVFSLHACDTATDITIAKGIQHGAKYIFSVSCCQNTIRTRLAAHPLTPVTRHGVYKERLADMVADSMRAAVLEANGYRVRVFEYVPSGVTPKNIMIRAMKVGSANVIRKHQARTDYSRLSRLFNVKSALMQYLGSSEPL